MTIAMEGQAFTLASAQTVRYGTGSKWTSKVVSGTGECTDAFFGNDKMSGLAMTAPGRCRSGTRLGRARAGTGGCASPGSPRRHRCSDTTVAITTPSTTPTTSQTVVHGGIAVDTTSQPVPQPGVSSVMLTAPGAIPPAPAPGDWEADGAFRLLCNWSKMSYDDPIVYPGQPASAPPHVLRQHRDRRDTTSENIRSKGNAASCRGGTINLSGYWTPSMIDTATGKPIAPKVLLIYYKTGFWQYFNDNSVMQPIPKGLKMIAGDGGRSTAGGVASFGCIMPAVGLDRAGTHRQRDPEELPARRRAVGASAVPAMLGRA